MDPSVFIENGMGNGSQCIYWNWSGKQILVYLLKMEWEMDPSVFIETGVGNGSQCIY